MTRPNRIKDLYEVVLEYVTYIFDFPQRSSYKQLSTKRFSIKIDNVIGRITSYKQIQAINYNKHSLVAAATVVYQRRHDGDLDVRHGNKMMVVGSTCPMSQLYCCLEGK